MPVNLSSNITIIGAGHMATSILTGLQGAKFNLAHICIDKNPEKLATLAQQFAVQTSQHNTEAIERAQIVILAIKRKVYRTSLKNLHQHLRMRPWSFLFLPGSRLQNLLNA